MTGPLTTAAAIANLITTAAKIIDKLATAKGKERDKLIGNLKGKLDTLREKTHALRQENLDLQEEKLELARMNVKYEKELDEHKDWKNLINEYVLTALPFSDRARVYIRRSESATSQNATFFCSACFASRKLIPLQQRPDGYACPGCGTLFH